MYEWQVCKSKRTAIDIIEPSKANPTVPHYNAFLLLVFCVIQINRFPNDYSVHSSDHDCFVTS